MNHARQRILCIEVAHPLRQDQKIGAFACGAAAFNSDDAKEQGGKTREGPW